MVMSNHCCDVPLLVQGIDGHLTSIVMAQWVRTGGVLLVGERHASHVGSGPVYTIVMSILRLTHTNAKVQSCEIRLTLWRWSLYDFQLR